jgi:hypothetical protein
LRNALMLKKDLETRRISRIGSLIVPPPPALSRRYFFRISFAAQRGLLIKQKAAAQGNTEQTSERFHRFTNRDIASRNRPSP